MNILFGNFLHFYFFSLSFLPQKSAAIKCINIYIDMYQLNYMLHPRRRRGTSNMMMWLFVIGCVSLHLICFLCLVLLCSCCDAKVEIGHEWEWEKTGNNCKVCRFDWTFSRSIEMPFVMDWEVFVLKEQRNEVKNDRFTHE